MYTDYNYRYIVTPTKVIALSTYAGKTVRGVAKCHPSDKFDVEYGKQLAAARCNEKIAGKRYKRAFRQFWDLMIEVDELNDRVARAQQYLKDATDAEKDAILATEAIRGKCGQR